MMKMSEEMKVVWKAVWFLSLFVAGVHSNKYFFPMNSLHFSIPPPHKKPFQSLLPPLVTIQALPFTPSLTSNPPPLTYTFTGTPFLKVHNTSSSIDFTDDFFTRSMSPGEAEELSGWLEVQDGDGGYNRTQIRVEIESEGVKCDGMREELCFWKDVVYNVPENYPNIRVGELGSKYLKKYCSRFDVNYTLLNHTNSFFINSDTLHTLRPLDRDYDRLSRGLGSSYRHLEVGCSVVSPSGDVMNITKTLRVDLLDVNDHPPKPQFAERVLEIVANNEEELKAKLHSLDQLFFRDWDSPGVNNYTVELYGDDLHLFSPSHTIWPDDRDNQHQTALHFKLEARPGAKIPDEGYEVIVVVNDAAMDPKYGDSSANLTIRFRPRNIKTAKVMVANLRKNMLYPSSVNILRSAALFSRISQPKKDINISQCRFDLKRHSRAFNVTLRGGIIFINKVSILRNLSSPIQLEVKWRNKTSSLNYSDLIIIHLEDETISSCKNSSDTSFSWGHCASQDTKKSCEKTCGLGSGSLEDFKSNGHSRCTWIPGDNSEKLTKYYATCTPHRTTCPDSKCDELEKLHHWLCPQDCSEKVSFLAEKNKNTSRGIYKGLGVCKCDNMCYCSLPSAPVKMLSPTSTMYSATPDIIDPEISQESTKTSNISRRTDDTYPVAASFSPFPLSCGPSCVLTIAGGALFLLAVSSVLVACWRRRRVQDAARRDRKLAAAVAAQHYTHDSSGGAGMEMEMGTLGGQLMLSFDMGGGSYAAPKIIPVVDAKWEFPREKLRIEQTLGEGEFGRVLRARALEIANLPGHTTVAVKTLKEGAREAELTDLMSEYQLLKEVSHPNVIRLLGACTMPGGPVYLIIEFAEHGSLRNYLRRSRHLESDCIPNSASMLGESDPVVIPVCKISSKDILSFAWQISKGMNYLNDMKLVHRDLAARNVLLAGDMVCKISDFGLTRDVYEDDTYLKRTKGRVPVKWMAPESLADNIYNSKSDVWSFGILLWELVTLGASPYPGIAVQNLFHLLRSGYRMEKPENCSMVLYKIMRTCWSEDVNERPSFRTLMMKFESMLADGMDYLDLNPRTVHNRYYFTNLAEAIITPDELEETAVGYGSLTITQPENVNFLSRPQSFTKCAETDKLQVLWKRPSSSLNITYENEEKTQEINHYESPIKRNKELKTPTNERPTSYLDMGGTTEGQTLLRSKSKE